MEFLSHLKGIITEPTATFERLIHKDALNQALTVLLLDVILMAIPLQVTAQGGMGAGLNLFVLCLIRAFLPWALCSLLCHAIGTLVFRGKASLRQMFIVCGFACAIWLIIDVLALFNLTGGLGGVVLWAWWAIVLVLGVRETYELTTGQAAGACVPSLFATAITCSAVILFGSAYLVGPPMAMPDPKTTEFIERGERTNLLLNAGFEETKDDKPEHWDGQVTQGVPGVEFKIDTEVAHTGDASAFAGRSGLKASGYYWWQQLLPSKCKECGALVATEPPKPGPRSGGAPGCVPTQQAAAPTPDPAACPHCEQKAERTPLLTAGARVQVTAWVKTQAAEQTVLLLVFLDEQMKPVPPEKDAKRIWLNAKPVTGTTDWTRYGLVAVVPEKATSAFVQVMAWGAGSFWVDDVELIDTAVPPKEQPKSPTKDQKEAGPGEPSGPPAESATETPAKTMAEPK